MSEKKHTPAPPPSLDHSGHLIVLNDSPETNAYAPDGRQPRQFCGEPARVKQENRVEAVSGDSSRSSLSLTARKQPVIRWSRTVARFAIAAAGCALTLFSLTLVGCGSMEIARGPIYEWETERPASTYTPMIPIKFIDARPPWEHVYHEPPSDVRAYRFAQGMIPLENFRPLVDDRIVQIVDDAMLPLESKASFGDVTLSSFRVVINEIEPQRCAYERKYRVREPNPLQLKFGDNVTVDVGLSLSSDPEPPPPPPMASPGFKFSDGKRVKLGPPSQLKGNYPTGVTAELSGQVRLVWDGEPDFLIPFDCRIELDYCKSGMARGDAVVQVVDHVLEELRSQVQQQLRSREIGPSLPLPD